MQSFDYSQTQSGLILALDGADEAAVSRALKAYDPDLRLVPKWKDENGITYAVYRVISSSESVLVCIWGDDAGKPYPLSSSILEKVKSYDLNTRGVPLDENELERKRVEREQKRRESLAEDIADDYGPRAGRSAVLPRTRNMGNRRWKEEQFQIQKHRLRKG